MTTSENRLNMASDALSQRISSFLTTLDTVFVRIASELPIKFRDVESVIGMLAQYSEATFMDETYAQLKRLESRRKQTDSTIQVDLDRFEQKLKATQKSFHQIQKHAAEILNRCEDLGLFSLNTRLITKHSQGVGASTFRAITLELTARSKNIAQLASQLQQDLSTAFNEYSQAKNDHVALNDTLDNLEIERQKAIETGTEQFKRTSDEIHRVSEDAHEVLDVLRPKVQQVMTDIQEQDILRQALEHIQKVLKKTAAVAVSGTGTTISSEMTNTDRAIFIEQAHELTTRLVDESRGHIHEFIENSQGSMAELSTLGDHIQRLKEFEQQMDALQQRITEPINLMLQQIDLMESMIKLLKETHHRLEKMNRTLKRTMITSQSMKSITSDLSLLEVTMRINGSSDPDLESESNALAKDFRGILSTIRTALQNIEKHKQNIQLQIFSTRDTNTEFGENLSGIRRDIKELKHYVAQSMKSLRNETKDSWEIGQSLSAFTDEMTPRLKDLMEMYPSSEDVSDIQKIAVKLAGELSENTGNEHDAECTVSHAPHQQEAHRHPSTHLEELVSEFAVFNQKLTAGNMLNINIDEGDTEGELTLF